MNRSNRFVFVPFCTCAQGVRATGIVKKYAATIRPVMDLLIKNDINIVQMPCPELFFDGFHRRPCGKPQYDTPGNRKVCRSVADDVVELVKMFKDNGRKIEAILGIDYSPSCAVNFIAGRPPQRRLTGKGIYIEELQAALHEVQIKVPFIGIQVYQIDKTLAELRQLIEGG